MRFNPVSTWFRPKVLGWGWSPARWEGWVVTFGAAAAITAIARAIG